MPTHDLKGVIRIEQRNKATEEAKTLKFKQKLF